MTASPQELCLGARISGASVTLASEARRRHLYIVGQTGTGKSTLLLNLIAQDLATWHCSIRTAISPKPRCSTFLETAVTISFI
jgi:ABC-type transport system involved in cytochrome bd biosynthesis fused ATPase/permease subunit